MPKSFKNLEKQKPLELHPGQHADARSIIVDSTQQNQKAYEDAKRFEEQQLQKDLEEGSISGEMVLGTGNYSASGLFSELQDELVGKEDEAQKETGKLKKAAPDSLFARSLKELEDELARRQAEADLKQKDGQGNAQKDAQKNADDPVPQLIQLEVGKEIEDGIHEIIEQDVKEDRFSLLVDKIAENEVPKIIEIVEKEEQEQEKEQVILQEVPKEIVGQANELFERRTREGNPAALERGREGFVFDFLQNWRVQQKVVGIREPGQGIRFEPGKAAGKFVDVPAREMDEKGKRKQEKRVKQRLQKQFADANLVTVREYEKLTDWSENGGGQELADEMEGKNMDQLRDDILSVEITSEKMTERYISRHIVELFQYTRKCREFTRRLGQEDGDAYLEGQSRLMRTRIQTEIILRGMSYARFLEEHMHMHGIRMEEDGHPVLIERKRKNPERRKEVRAYKERRNAYANLLSDSREMEDEKLQEIVNADFESRMAKMAKKRSARTGFKKLRQDFMKEMTDLREKQSGLYEMNKAELDDLQGRLLLLLIAGESPVPEFAASQENSFFQQKMNKMIARKKKQVEFSKQAIRELAQDYRIAYRFLIGASYETTPRAVKILAETRIRLKRKERGLDPM